MGSRVLLPGVCSTLNGVFQNRSCGIAKTFALSGTTDISYNTFSDNVSCLPDTTVSKEAPFLSAKLLFGDSTIFQDVLYQISHDFRVSLGE